MILCTVAAGFSPHIGTPQSFIFMRHWVRPKRMRGCSWIWYGSALSDYTAASRWTCSMLCLKAEKS